MTADQFRGWMKKYGLSLSRAAELLGYTRRQIVNYRNGHTDIGPRTDLAIGHLSQALARPGKRQLDKPKRLA